MTGQPPTVHDNMTPEQIDTFLAWAKNQNDRLEAGLDEARALLANDPREW